MVFYTLKKLIKIGDSDEIEFWLVDLNVIPRETPWKNQSGTPTMQYVRNVIIQENGINNQYGLNFTNGANNQMNSIIVAQQSKGIDPMACTYKMRSSKTGPEAKNLSRIILAGETKARPQNIIQPTVPVPQNPVQQPTTPQTIPPPKNPDTGFSFDKAPQTPNIQDAVSLDRNIVSGFDKSEGDLFDSLSNQTEKYSKETFVQLWLNNIEKIGKTKDLARAELIFEKLYA